MHLPTLNKERNIRFFPKRANLPYVAPLHVWAHYSDSPIPRGLYAIAHDEVREKSRIGPTVFHLAHLIPAVHFPSTNKKSFSLYHYIILLLSQLSILVATFGFNPLQPPHTITTQK